MKPILLLLFVTSLTLANAQDYWQQRVEYKMDIDFDVKKHQFEGDQTLKYFNNSTDTLNKVFFHLYFNAFQPESMMDVRSRTIEDPDRRVQDRISKLDNSEIGYHKINSLDQNGEKLDFIVEGTVMEVILNEPIVPGASTVFNMTFESQVPKQIRRSGRDNSEGIDYSMAQWFPKMAEYDERGWHSHSYVAREFYAPWGNYEVNLSIDKDYIVAGTGTLQNANEIGYGYQDAGVEVKRKGKKVTWKFKAENVHDFVWAADPDYKHVIANVPDGPVLHFFYQEKAATDESKGTEAWNELPALTVKAFEFIQKNFGKYPFSHYSVIQGGDGGMEYPMATLITGERSLASLVGVTVHEALHSWYQGLLATNESYYAWMDEGYTSYASNLTMAHLFDRDVKTANSGSYRGYFYLANSGKEEPMSTHADHFNTNMAYGSASYSKGAVSIAQLGYVIGENARNEGLLKYFNQWKFKHPNLNDFIRVMEKTSDLELDWYYDYFVNTTHKIDYAIDSVGGDDKSTTVSLKRIGKMPMPMDIYVTLTDGSKKIYYAPLAMMRGEKPNDTDLERVILPDWSWTHPTYTFKIDTPLSQIQSIQIDESERLADIYAENNKWVKE